LYGVAEELVEVQEETIIIELVAGRAGCFDVLGLTVWPKHTF